MSENTAPRRHAFANGDESVMMSVAFAESQSGAQIKNSLVAALAFMLFLIWTPLPSMSAPNLNRDKDVVKPQKRKVIKPPPEKPIDVVQTRQKKVKKTPMPDLTPDEPEPVVEEEAPDEPDFLPSDDWDMTIPDGPPPEVDGVVNADDVGVEKPIFTRRVKPNFPEKALKVKLEGYVLLEAILRKNGSIDSINVVRGLGKGKFGFEEEAIAALKQWKFLPGKVNGKPADVRMSLKIEFQLQ